MVTTKKDWKPAFLLVLLLGIVMFASFGESFTVGPNYRNVSVDTTVNITNAKPEVLAVDINNGQENLTLNAGSTFEVVCNASLRDYNGGSTITNVSATFFDNATATDGSPDDNNDHYTNTTCALGTANGVYRNASCGFDVFYYANAAPEWVCNVTVTDSEHNFNGTDSDSGFNITEVNTLYALNVTNLIDYGDLAVEDTSSPQEANVTNFGNVAINVSVYGYGATPNDGLAMVCDQGDISIENEKFSLVSGADFSTGYTSLASSNSLITGLTLDQQTNDAQQVINSTYWRLYVPPNPFGVCNGTVVFQAEPAQ